MELKKQKEDTNEKAKSTKKKPQEQRGNELTTMTPIVSNSRKKNSKEVCVCVCVAYIICFL